jgi:hypothetical protein
MFQTSTRGLEPFNYRGMLVNTFLHATVYMFLHNLLTALVQIASKIGLQKEIGPSVQVQIPYKIDP